MAVEHKVTFENGFALTIEETEDGTYTLGLESPEQEDTLWTTITNDDMYDLEGLIGNILH